MPYIQSYLHQSIRDIMQAEGFVFNKLNFSFSRKRGKHTEKFGFIFVDQTPNNYRVNFLLETSIPEISKLKHACHLFRHIPDFRYCSLILFMGDMVLHDSSRPSLFDYKLVTTEDLFFAGMNIANIIQDKAFPLCDALSDIDGVDSFLEKRPDWSAASLNMDNISTELIAARLNGKRNFQEVFGRLIAGIDARKEYNELYSDPKRTIEKLYDYLK